MTIDNESIFQNDRTLHKIHHMYKNIIANLLHSRFKKKFKTTKTNVGNQIVKVDLMSEDKTIAVKIINSKLKMYDKINPSTFQRILSATLVLSLVDSRRKLLIFTNKIMYEKFCSIFITMPYPVSHLREIIEIVCVPLSDGLDDDVYCDGTEELQNFENCLNHLWTD